MAIPHLTEDQIQNWTREQKDQWWLTKVFRGDMPQLTIRSALTGFILGGLLSMTNLYIGAKTGWSLGVGLTSVILAFAMFKVLAGIGLSRDFTILENNCMQSIATSAGYMTGPLISGIAAYMMVSNTVMPWHEMLLLNIVLALLGVLVAFPMKRRFINDEQHPFPEGAACGVVLDTLYTSDAKVGLFKAKALGAAAGLAGFISFAAGSGYQTLIQVKALGLKAAHTLPLNLDGWYYWLVQKGHAKVPRIFGSDIRCLGLSPTVDLAMIGAGGLLNIRYAVSMLLGMAVMWGGLAPWAVSHGDVTRPLREKDAAGRMVTVGIEKIVPAVEYSYRDVLVSWALWPGIAILVVASMLALFAKPKLIISAFTGLFSKRDAAGKDVLRHIELPLWVSFVGVPIIGALGVWMLHDWYGVHWHWGALSIPLIIVLTLIAANSTALTSITPTGSLSKITQFTFGGLERATALKAGTTPNPATNLMTALMTTEVAGNASNLLMDIKPGYMLGAKPRQQAIGHCIGIVAGAAASTPMFYILFMSKAPEGAPVIDQLVRGQFAFPGALQWKGVSDLLSKGIGDLPSSALWVMGIAAVLGVIFEVARMATKNRFPISPIALGLGVVIPPESTMAMFAGSAFFYIMGRLFKKRDESSFGRRLWVDTHEPICAGIIAGAALVGIGDIVVDTLFG
ncbi:MAG: OPT/YSL family transporter [Phycisphaerales bacterium]|nr:OPT/YSL family transporter [Phycisphaerales bacterium]